jgi:hypothetical protein
MPLRGVLEDVLRLRKEWTCGLGRDDLSVKDRHEVLGFLSAMEERIDKLETDLS